MSDTAALPLALSQDLPKARTLRIPRRPLKLLTAGAFVMAGAYGILNEQKYVSSSNAIVSAYTLEIRTPADGNVTGLPHQPGEPVHAGDLLAHLDNPLVDRQHLDNLRTIEDTAVSTADADAGEADALDRQRRALLVRAEAHASAVTIRLGHTVTEQEATVAAREIALHQADGELERGRKLHDAGIVAHADFDRLVTTAGLARQEFATAKAELASLRAQQSSAAQGLLSEPGTNNDVAYSRQRADELAMKLAETDRSLAASRAEAREAQAAVLAESTRAAMLRSFDLRSPIAGIVWKLDAMDGERAASGDAVVSLVECSRQFLLVEIPQERLPDIALGKQARFRLAGETAERTGTVVAATGDPQHDTNHKFAAFPLQDTNEQLATVRVALDPGTHAGPDACTIGRTARVLLPTQPTSYLGRVFRQYF